MRAGNVHLQPFHRVLSASLSRRFPEAIAEAGDTVGLTIDTLRDVERGASALVLLCVDLTEQVLSEAASARAHFVVTYSPMPHSPFTTLSTDDVLGRIVLGCAKHQIAVHSVHSACDAASGGVNAWLARSLARGVVRPIVKHPKVADAGQGRVLECDEATPISTVVERLKALLGVRFLRLALAAVVAPEALAKAQEFLTVKTVAVGEGATLLRGWTGDLLELESEFADSDWNVLFK
ncbi:NIF3-like protein [Emiliania huxleyi CCMP1516]|uniref:NIF3-like protein n=2 Tax=Emiliania huxleyi TaxID=2903 RepID=A0A0D3KC62_EMIH1|nr:NIF3-like protein [Emiliania huxleyi CCMP1516]EOD33347.1 NIF3-like protein [Emiliania huxleyi CCMP1516]|eukprot:XP_005785776.1 NIF3-like protein [Emiliania huxleyi CCMP1516]